MPDKAREASLYALGRCRRDGAWSAMTIDAAIKKYDLDGRDAGFMSRLTLGVMENITFLDHYIGLYSSSPVTKLEPRVLDVLRLSAYQLVFMDRVPQSAAVNEGVELCKSSGCGKAAGLVNAVLRRIAENRDKLPEIPCAGTAGYLAIRYSHPQWLADELTGEYGYDFTERFFAANNQPSPLYIQVNTLKTDAAKLGQMLSDGGFSWEKHRWLDDCLLVSAPGAVASLPGFGDGLFYVQDPAARYCVVKAGLEPGMKVLDVCAAPGGKSFAAAIDMKNIGSIMSRDIHEKKTRLIAAGAERLGISIIRTAAMDAREKTGDEFDAVIADVPCSGIGVIRSKPEIRYKDRAGLSGLPDIQLDILRASCDSVKPGGVLMYSTCTVLKDENEGVIASFLEERNDFAAEEQRTFWPQTDGTDGFFVCRLRKKL